MIISNSTRELLPSLINRHGLITGATGTGKTVTLRVIVEQLSSLGVPCFLADVKGELSGLARAGNGDAKVQERINLLKLTDFQFTKFPVETWDLYEETGQPIKTTVENLGPLLVAKLLELNRIQTGIVALAFKIAKDTRIWSNDPRVTQYGTDKLYIKTLEDLKVMLRYMANNSNELILEYGNISMSSVGAIIRSIIELEGQDANQFFDDPTDVTSFLNGRINILKAEKLIRKPKFYSTFLLWLLTELYEKLPETGDAEKPKFVFFFDEAHLLFENASHVLVKKVEETVKLIRSKGVGVWFITQSPFDIPEGVLRQLGNRIQHALRAFTPREQRALKAVASTFRRNPKLDTMKALSELRTGEALASFLLDSGEPSEVERVLIYPPKSYIGV